MILDRFLLTDKVAVVTGAGRGIGAATALALAEAGADVVLSARTAEQLDKIADQIAGTGRGAHVVPADLSDPAAAAALADTAAEQFGRIDIVVNNVGGTLPRPLLDTSTEFLEDAFRFNVSTAHALTSASVPHLLASGDGSIVNISSIMGRVTGRGFLAYGTAKAALAHYTRLAATDLSPKIRVNAVAVGSVATSALEVVVNNPELRERMESATPLRRIGDPDDIAATVIYLCSRAGGYVTGKVFEVDGGLEAPNLDFGLADLT
ncbi:short-chain dehydrogenase [Prauserella marina]|uniref:7-alpha-hydroxysteroid dehydrogenase n=1 Tax=Prauserella marina TaxID=530584 RepID=A0A222VUG0_9PSEU|nr:SDR family oxidoreductase [Prauserella marina]ASR37544.1 short-chain dehydrogenase [Prauserella marina]PWV75444.1 7-alpha-hydroxysteroid dehydrogenase [Prauserella marina]SDD34423.1 7-alpha-hydroxysteroid dehydrogenase [Prauserella marina]